MVTYEYDCVKCQAIHYDNQSEYKEHILDQSKHGIKQHYHHWIKADEWGYNCWCGAYKD
jgi:hypothetical protein